MTTRYDIATASICRQFFYNKPPHWSIQHLFFCIKANSQQWKTSYEQRTGVVRKKKSPTVDVPMACNYIKSILSNQSSSESQRKFSRSRTLLTSFNTSQVPAKRFSITARSGKMLHMCKQASSAIGRMWNWKFYFNRNILSSPQF